MLDLKSKTNRHTLKTTADLAPIPAKRYFTIGEVSELCELKPHVLRYWEQEFAALKPVKRSNRRYYQVRDVELVRRIRELLYERGFTIQGARAELSQKVKSANQVATPSAKPKPSSDLIAELEGVVALLEEV